MTHAVTQAELANQIRRRVDGLEERRQTRGALNQDELWKLCRALGVDTAAMVCEQAGPLHCKHLRHAIAEEIGLAGEDSVPDDWKHNFYRPQKRVIKHALDDRQEES